MGGLENVLREGLTAHGILHTCPKVLFAQNLLQFIGVQTHLKGFNQRLRDCIYIEPSHSSLPEGTGLSVQIIVKYIHLWCNQKMI